HRALAAIRLGITTVPVIDYREPTETFNQSPVTQTEAFENWFGDSKVVNEDGSPKVMYHGTLSDFDAFSGDRRLHFVSPSPEWVTKFTQDSEGAIAEGA